MSQRRFDVLVIGGGHAGAEAAWSAARLGAQTALVTFQRAAIGRMSCNPAVGGIGKGQIVREVDALGGLMGRVTDEAGIQFRMLNRRKGPAMWAPRAQCDRDAYAHVVRRHLEHCPNLTILEAGVERITAERSTRTPLRVSGVELHDGTFVAASAVIVTSGTFLAAIMHCGERKAPGGRIGEAAAGGLSRSLSELGLQLGRLKTGTPPRIACDRVDFARLAEQPGDALPTPFSFLTPRIEQPQVCCWITYTNPAVHALLRANLHRAPMYSGQIQSRGPRYCPSIEDKVVRFADKDRHQVFLEPEGRNSDRIYVNGVSTSLPQDVQVQMIAMIEGLEQARIVQFGYAVEYDFVPPEQLHASLMTKAIAGLFLAGQICGTSGYEEAAGQGIIAGVNAARFIAGAEPVVLGRDEAYIGVMIDDLVTRGVTEPYRMFTSRAEYRMHLRYDNADARLSPLGRRIGLVNAPRWQRYERKRAAIEALRAELVRCRYENRPLSEWLKQPDEDGQRFVSAFPSLRPFLAEADVWARALVDIKYAGYLEREARAIERFRQLEERLIPDDADFDAIPHLRREALERWKAVRPRSVGQAARVSGVNPADVSMLLVHLARSGRLALAEAQSPLSLPRAVPY
jgi:tRNA uridine 5-carboxymethylaminomethyl modification enzyme